MACQCLDELACCNFVNMNRATFGSDCQGLAVVDECDVLRGIGLIFNRVEQLEAIEFPEADTAIVTSAGNGFPIW